MNFIRTLHRYKKSGNFFYSTYCPNFKKGKSKKLNTLFLFVLSEIEIPFILKVNKDFLVIEHIVLYSSIRLVVMF